MLSPSKSKAKKNLRNLLKKTINYQLSTINCGNIQSHTSLCWACRSKSNRAETESNRAEPKSNRVEPRWLLAIKFSFYATIIFLLALRIFLLVTQNKQGVVGLFVSRYHFPKTLQRQWYRSRHWQLRDAVRLLSLPALSCMRNHFFLNSLAEIMQECRQKTFYFFIYQKRFCACSYVRANWYIIA